MWVSEGPQRWLLGQADGSSNYLLADDTGVTELHVGVSAATFHRYAGTVTDDVSPLAGLSFGGTVERPSLAGASADEAWRALAAFR